METAGGRSASLKDHVLRSIEESIAVKELLKSQTDNIARATEIIVRCIRNGGKILLFGNGGSAADAQHIAAEFMGRYLLERPPIPAIALTVNTSSLTAIANDIGFESIFDRHINALCTSKDIVIGISTSGNSRNVLQGIEAARVKGATTIGLTGGSGGKLVHSVDIAIVVPSQLTSRIQESHILIGHIFSELAEREISRAPFEADETSRKGSQ